MGKAWWSRTGERSHPQMTARPVIVTADLQMIEKEAILSACAARGVPLVIPPTLKRPEEKKVRLVDLAEKVGIDGIFFRSRKEGSRYIQLRLGEKGGTIRDLKLQPRFKLHVVNLAGLKVCITEYTADFDYWETLQPQMAAVRLFDEAPGEKRVIEDTKGLPTKDWELRRKWVETEYGITIRVT